MEILLFIHCMELGWVEGRREIIDGAWCSRRPRRGR